MTAPAVLLTMTLLAGMPGWAYGSAAGSGSGSSAPTYAVEYWLRTSYIYSITQDKAGYLWLGTASGLVRFDGYSFATWGAGGEPALPADLISVVLAGTDGSIWVGFNGISGVSRILNGQLHNYATRDGLSAGAVKTLIEDHHGIVWAGGRGGLSRFRDGRWEYLRRESGLPEVAVIGLYEDRSGTIWVGTSAGVFRRTAASTTFERFSTEVVVHFSEDAAGVTWATSRAGSLNAVLPEPDQKEVSCAAGRGLSSLYDRRGNLWIATTDHGVLRARDLSRARCESIDSSYEPTGKRVLSLFRDQDDNIWAGTDRGLLRIYQADVTTIPHLLDVAGNRTTTDRTRAIEVTADGTVWVGTDHGLSRIVRFEEGELRVRSELRGVGITALKDTAAGLWVATRDSLGLFANGRFTSSVPVNDARESFVFTLTSDASGTPWLCHANDTNVYHLLGIGALSRFDREPGLLTKSCTAVYGDHRGRIWLGFEDGSVAVREGEDVHMYPAAVVGRVAAFYDDGRGAIWIATSGGLSRFEDGRLATLTDHNGLPGRSLSAVIEDNAGYLWVALSSGIMRLSRQEFDKAAHDSSYQVQYTLYNSSDGLLDAPAAFGAPTATRGGDGRLWFLTSNGLAMIDPARTRRDAPSAVTRVERIVADEQVFLNLPDRVALPSRTLNIEINYSIVSLSAASKARFQYMLKGFDKDWVNAGVRRQAFYTKLPPGSYEFLVRGFINGSERSSSAWAFSVQPAFYQTSWFVMACVATSAMILWGAWLLRLSAIRRQFAVILDERARIGRELHDTVLQSMAGVALDLEAVARQTDVSAVVATDELRRIRRDLEDHMTEARQSIYELRSATGDTRTLVEILRESADQLFARQKAAFELTVTGEARDVSRQVKDQLHRIVQEAVRNALRHGKAQHVRADLEFERHSIRFRVTDDGCGFDPDVPTSGLCLGLMGMRERSTRMGAEFVLRSQPGRGTTIEVVIPTSERHGDSDAG
jgi:ligand-binding sensor domain-containing protein/signal transduction histidine kinase